MQSPTSPSMPRLPPAPHPGAFFSSFPFGRLSLQPLGAWPGRAGGAGGGVDGEGWVSKHATWGGSQLPSQWLLVQREGTGDKGGTLVDVVKKRDLPKVSERLQQKDKKERTGRLTGGYGAMASWGRTRRGGRSSRVTAGTGRRQPACAGHLLRAWRPSRAPHGSGRILQGRQDPARTCGHRAFGPRGPWPWWRR